MTAIKLTSLRLAPFLAGAAIIFLSCADKGTDPENRPPRITSPSSVEAVIFELFSYTATATDPDGDELDIGFENYPDWMTVAGAVISGTPDIQVADAAFTVIASDDFLADTLIVAITIVETPTNNPPQITSADSVEALVNETFSYTAAATDADGTTPTIRFEDIPGWTDTSGAVISGTPTAETADTSFTIIASDGELADTLTVSVIILFISYANQIQPIFNSNCSGPLCHIGGSSNGLRLNSYSTLMQGGISGAVVIPGDPQNSIIIKRLEGRIIPQMPFGGSPLPQATIQLIRDWIAEGAHDN